MPGPGFCSFSRNSADAVCLVCVRLGDLHYRGQSTWAETGVETRTESTRCPGGRGGGRTLMPLRATDFKSVVYAYSTTRPWRTRNANTAGFGGCRVQKNWRRHPDSNRGIKALQASALPLGYAASAITDFTLHDPGKSISNSPCGICDVGNAAYQAALPGRSDSAS